MWQACPQAVFWGSGPLESAVLLLCPSPGTLPPCVPGCWGWWGEGQHTAPESCVFWCNSSLRPPELPLPRQLKRRDSFHTTAWQPQPRGIPDRNTATGAWPVSSAGQTPPWSGS